MIEEPTFRRAVILLLDHSEDGSLGVVLNDPSNLEVDDVVPEWSDVLEPVVAVGGPVQTDAGVAVARVLHSETADLPDSVRVVSSSWAVVDLDSAPETLTGHIVAARLFLGYAGWGPGQLESELRTQSWWVVDSQPGDLEWAGVEDRRVAWREVLLRQPNELRLAADYPDNATFN
jgi:putative transcriptional regulator